ncbi:MULTISPECIES: nitroreductase family protein [Priestia]|uniref:nitroreductase family protein n=1 Tax=Priestia TaxID=2800373 RepID=UPI00064C80C0|nr:MULTISPECIES: nitroreductase [Priestia]MCJ7989189.1 nitroreductase [Priestia sp. OVS21]KLV29398.1 cobalamin biosynthesis protein CbiY [Priestia megaterium]MBU8756310.1 nitroreductase [Priestia megaterium]MCE4092016.1 nitroreductase [Priestia megaterium]MCU7711517.1 nitroreductase [Priestia megaterium]
MTIISQLKERRAVRDHEAREVEQEKIEQLLEAATWAPNDRMREPWSFYVIQGEAKKKYEELAEAYLKERFPTKPHLVESSLKAVKNTPVHIVVTADTVEGDDEATEDNKYAVSCAIHSMWLAAKELGLGFVWRTRGVGLVRDERLYEFIGKPSGKVVVGNVFLGYPNEESLIKMKEPARTPFTEKTTWL